MRKLDGLYGYAKRHPEHRELLKDPKFVDFDNYVKNMKLRELPNVKALTQDDAHNICLSLKKASAESETAKIALAMFSHQWATAARTSDIRLTRKTNVEIGKNGTMKTLFVEGKGVKMRGAPYCVKSVNPFASAVAGMKRRNPEDQYLYPACEAPAAIKEIRAELKRHGDFNLRAIRGSSPSDGVERRQTRNSHVNPATAPRQPSCDT